MNIAMEQTEEYYEGQLKNRYGDCFIRGNNGERMKIITMMIMMSVYLFVAFSQNQSSESYC